MVTVSLAPPLTRTANAPPESVTVWGKSSELVMVNAWPAATVTGENAKSLMVSVAPPAGAAESTGAAVSADAVSGAAVSGAAVSAGATVGATVLGVADEVDSLEQAPSTAVQTTRASEAERVNFMMAPNGC
jgi:hypothetical protein